MIQTKKTVTGATRKQLRFIINNVSPINSMASYLSTTPEQEFVKVGDTLGDRKTSKPQMRSVVIEGLAERQRQTTDSDYGKKR